MTAELIIVGVVVIFALVGAALAIKAALVAGQVDDAIKKASDK